LYQLIIKEMKCFTVELQLIVLYLIKCQQEVVRQSFKIQVIYSDEYVLVLIEHSKSCLETHFPHFNFQILLKELKLINLQLAEQLDFPTI